MFAQWMKWTMLESVTKVASKIFQRLIGVAAASVAHTFLATAIVGLVQTIGGFLMARTKHQKILVDGESILGACLFGLFATISTILGFTVFFFGGDVGINTFIITLSIVPGALIDVFFFKHPLSTRQWLGVALAVLAGYSVLGWPSLTDALNLPIWVWLSLGIMLLSALNQGITQKIKKIDPFVKNFWGGFTTLVLSVIGLCFLGATELLVDFSSPMLKLCLSSIIIGVIVILMWSFNLMSYKDGAQIAIKKLLMNGAYLTMAMAAGILLFGEALTTAKIVGVLLYLLAFVLMDNGTWRYLFSRESAS